MNPAKLSPERRDSVCLECHLEGDVAIEQPNHHLSEFRPGENLADLVHYFVLADDGPRAIRALGQSEALAQSVCTKKSADALSCTNCHDPHFSPPLPERAAQLWEDAFRRAPGHSAIGLNLARLYCQIHQFRRALDITERELEFNPDDPAGKALLHQLTGDAPKCG